MIGFVLCAIVKTWFYSWTATLRCYVLYYSLVAMIMYYIRASAFAVQNGSDSTEVEVPVDCRQGDQRSEMDSDRINLE